MNSSAFSRRPMRWKQTPASANASAIAAPTPAPPPVMTAIRPSSARNGNPMRFDETRTHYTHIQNGLPKSARMNDGMLEARFIRKETCI